MAATSPSRSAKASAEVAALPPIRFATARAILLIMLFMLGNYWLSRHLGWGFDGPIFGVVMAGAGLAYAVIDGTLGEDLRKGWLRKIGTVVLDFRTLVSLWAALLLASLVWSSLTIVSDNSDDPLKATLVAVDGRSRNHERTADNEDDKNTPLHFYLLPTTPMGKSYRVSVSGYLPVVVQVYPIVGATIVPNRDLQIAPSVLFRPPELALGPMEGGVRIQAYVTKDGHRTQLGKDEQVGAQSILIGNQRPISATLLESWRMEVLAEGIRDESEIAKLLQDWKKPHVLASAEGQLEPNTTLELIVYSPTGQMLATGKVLVTSETLQDVPLELAKP